MCGLVAIWLGVVLCVALSCMVGLGWVGCVAVLWYGLADTHLGWVDCGLGLVVCVSLSGLVNIRLDFGWYRVRFGCVYAAWSG